jgi:RimJ/RimL family protein N-acetyltransferase
MYPDLTADDIFCLETKRLWLRWPRASDAGALTSFASLAVAAEMTAAIPHPYPPGEAERFIFRSRAGNADGKGLVLAITEKRDPHHPIGVISATAANSTDIELGYILAPRSWGKGFASEAARAVVDAVFSLTPASTLVANARVVNPASRRVLEKCGFVYVDTGLDPMPARGGLQLCDRFVLERKAWTRRHGAAGTAPPMCHQTPDRIGIERPTDRLNY